MRENTLLKASLRLRGLLTRLFSVRKNQKPPPNAEREELEEDGPLSREEILHLREIQITSSALYDPRRDQKAPFGSFAGRPIIKGGSAISGGVYLGLFGHEALVVDEKSDYLRNAYEELLARLMRYGALRDKSEQATISEVVALTRDFLRYDEELVSHLLEQEGLESDQLVSLDLFLREGIGAARHQILLAGWLLEQLIRNSVIKGHAYLESTLDRKSAPLERLIYTTARGENIIFDPRAYDIASHTKLAVGARR